MRIAIRRPRCCHPGEARAAEPAIQQVFLDAGLQPLEVSSRALTVVAMEACRVPERCDEGVLTEPDARGRIVGQVHGLEFEAGTLRVHDPRLPDRPARRMIPVRWITMLQAARKNLRRVYDMTVGQFYRELAKLGGFIGRTGDGEPGWITIWRGWQKLSLMVRGAELAQAVA